MQKGNIVLAHDAWGEHIATNPKGLGFFDDGVVGIYPL